MPALVHELSHHLPLTYRGVNGVAWATPWVLALNYFAHAGAYLWLWRRGGREPEAGKRIERRRAAIGEST